MITDLYPFSTKDAKAIPLDIIRPLSSARVAFADGVPSAVIDPAIADPVLILSADAPCVVRFGAVPEVPSSAFAANQLLLGPDVTMIVAPQSPTFQVMGDGAAGNLSIQVIAKWAGLGVESQITSI